MTGSVAEYRKNLQSTQSLVRNWQQARTNVQPVQFRRKAEDSMGPVDTVQLLRWSQVREAARERRVTVQS